MSSGTLEPFRREMADSRDVVQPTETEFEKPRGINRVEIRRGFLTIHISGFDGDASEVALERLKILEHMRVADISIDFLKLTGNGLSFVAPEALQNQIADILERSQVRFSLLSGRCIVLAHAANMRDEEGLIARVVSEVIGTGVEIDHLGDMHDRVLLVMDSQDGERVADVIRERLIGQ